VAQLTQHRRLIDTLTGRADRAMSLWIARYRDEVLANRERAESTRDSDRQKLRTIEARFGSLQIDAITTADIADFLREYEQAGKSRMAVAMRTVLTDCFRAAIGAGWVDVNPVTPTYAAKVSVRRQRLELPEFLRIVEIAERDCDPWVANSFLLALVTGLRREDVAVIGPTNLMNPDGQRDGRLWVEPLKTRRHGIKISFPLDLRLQAINLSIGEVITRCRSRHVLTRYFVHHTKHAGRAVPGAQVRPATISAEFAACRDKLDIDWGTGTPPTFHELRSLATRLYDRQGTDSQALLGHKNPETTALYRDKRKVEWIMVS
jgi:integrase